MNIEQLKVTALELETGRSIEGYFYEEAGYFTSNGVPDLNRPVKRYYLVDENGQHLEAAETTVKLVTDELAQLRQKYENLKAYIDLWAGVDRFVRSHSSVPLGASIPEACLRLLREGADAAPRKPIGVFPTKDLEKLKQGKDSKISGCADHMLYSPEYYTFVYLASAKGGTK